MILYDRLCKKYKKRFLASNFIVELDRQRLRCLGVGKEAIQTAEQAALHGYKREEYKNIIKTKV